MLQGHGILEYPLALVFTATLHPIGTELVDRLRHQPEMAAHGNRTCREMTHRLHLRRTAFDLDHVRTTFLHQAARGIQGLLRRAVTHERHIGDDHRPGADTHHVRRVVDHVANRDRKRAFVSLHHHTERIADQDHIHTRRLDLPGERGVVAGNDGDLLTGGLHPVKRAYRVLAHLSSCGITERCASGGFECIASTDALK